MLIQGSQSWDQNQEFEDIFAQFFGGGGRGAGGFGGFSGGSFGGFGGFRAKGPDIHARIRWGHATQRPASHQDESFSISAPAP